MASITHIVLFKYRSSVSWVELEAHFRAFTQLQHTCLKPNGKPYMISMKLGKNTSWEPFGKGMTHAFILGFASTEDRDYYLLKDPVHHAFSAKAGPLIEDSVVVDFEAGKLFADPTAGVTGLLHKGSCHCGDIKFEVSLEDPRHVLCHCRTCQLLGGGPYSLNAIVPIDKIRITNGQPRVYSYTGASGKQVLCYHCGNCTSHIYHVQMMAPENAIVRTGLLDNAGKLGVGGEIFSEGALGWVKDLKSALPA